VTKLIILDYADCWFKYRIISLLQGMCFTLILLKNLEPTTHVT